MDGLPPGLPEGFVPPDGFIAPSNTPLHVETNPVPTDRGEGRVMMRVETVHGSFVCFMVPKVAATVAAEMADAAARAELNGCGDGNPMEDLVIPTSADVAANTATARNREERRHGR
jgi:hypothetical protein